MLLLLLLAAGQALGAEKAPSHPPLRRGPPPSKRPLAPGPSYFVDAQKGDDGADGGKAKPWKTVRHALTRLRAGDTLYLRGGVYHENVSCSLVGTPKAPITVRSFPGEPAILDGGLPEFQKSPEAAWVPVPGEPGEYRSKRAYPNRRDFVGAFGDSLIGLQTYWHASDLRSKNELATSAPGKDLDPLYCGPGLWYDRDGGHIHVRLAHTHQGGVPNYRGPEDPRKLPLIIAPFRSVVLRIDDARHVRFQDLVVRGGGYETVVVSNALGVEFDNVTIRGGTYCMRTGNARQMRFVHSAMYGNAPPWTFRGDGSLRNRPGHGRRDIARLTCHALWVTDTGREFSVYAFPTNDDWEIAHSEFTDSHDGLYLGGINLRFHHNLVDHFHDDGIYLSPMYAYGPAAQLHIYQNHFSRCLTALAYGGPENTRDTVWLYRNVFDLRGTVNVGRPTTKGGKPSFSTGKLIGDHGSPPWSAMNIYHNTFVMGRSRSADMAALAGARKGHPRRVFNNLFLHLDRLPAFPAQAEEDTHEDGNLYWAPGAGGKKAEAFFDRYRKSPAFAATKASYKPGCTTHSLVAEPLFVKFGATGENDYRPQAKSPAVDAGVALPADWPDPLRKEDGGKPDIGAFPLGAKPWSVGRP